MNDGTLYEQVMGPAFDQLPSAVRRFHRLSGQHELHGWVETDAPASLPARALAVCLGTPLKAASGPIRFQLDASSDRETWSRHFPSKSMNSTLSVSGLFLIESLGVTRLSFALAQVAGGLEMQLRSLRFLGVPCPSWLLPRVVAREHGDADRLEFRVQAVLPLIGVVAAYRGHLLVPAEALE